MLILFTISAVSQTANFSFTSINNSFCTPATIKFTNGSTGHPNGYLWSFGNGQKSNAVNPIIVFNNAGTFKIRLVTVYANFTSEITKEVTIKASGTVELASDRDKICRPSAIQFDATTNSSTSLFDWDFGDNTPTQTTSTPTINHSYTTFGNFTTRISITNTNGCKASSSKIIKIAAPEISGSFSVSNGCVPALNTFNATVTLINDSYVSNYTWDFGDGSTMNNNADSIAHLYNNAGSYLPKLTITTAEGCSKTFAFDSVKYGTPPVNLVAYSLDSSICANEKATFIAKATNADEYEWNLGNGNLITTRDTIIEQKFSSLGVKTVIVTPKYHNCAGQSDTLTILVKGAIARFNYNNTCNDKRTFQFRNASIGRNLQYTWDFGNSSLGALTQSTITTFPAQGNFPIQLIASDSASGCADTATATIYTATPQLINNKTTLCINSNTQFKILNNYRNPTAIFQWNLMGRQIGNNQDTAVVVTANTLGIFNNSVIINNGRSYCPDTIELNHTIMVKGPNINFNAENSICQSAPLSVTNLSSPYLPADTISRYYWNFGDTTGIVSTQQPQPHQYQNDGTYNVILTGIDINGCKDSTLKQINVRPMPFIWIIPKNKTYCQGNTNSMIAYTSDSLLWRSTLPLQQFCSSCDTNLITPLHSNTFYATATNRYNCVSVDSSSIKIVEPFTATTNNPQNYICKNESATLNVGPADKKATWSPTTELNDANSLHPIVTPSASRTYKITLEDSLGCFSSTAEVEVLVKSNPEIELGANRFLPYKSSFTLNPKYNNHAVGFEWTPSDDLSCSNCANPVTLIDKTKNYSLKITSDSGCISTDDITLVVECNNAYLLTPTAFTPNNDGLNDVFYPIANGIKNIDRFVIFNRNSQLVFEQSNFSPNMKYFGWNGKYKGSEQPTGAYVYIIEASCDLGQKTIKRGSILLIR